MAMVVTWLSGVYGVTCGCGAVVYLREGHGPDETFAVSDAQAISDKSQAVLAYRVGAEMRAVAAYSKVMLPVSVAQVLLSILLVAASAMALAGRPGSRSFAMQTLAANAAFAIIAFIAKTETARALVMETFQRRAADRRRPDRRQTNPRSTGYRASGSPSSCGVLGFAAAAMWSKRTAFLEAVASARSASARQDDP